MTELLHPLFETPLPEGWQLTTVDAIKAKEPSSCVAGPFGSNISSKYFVETGIPIIRGSNLTADLARFRPEGFVFVSEERAQKYAPQHVRAGDLVFTCWGTIGQVGLIPEDGPYAEYIISNKQLKLRPDSGAADSEYLFFYFAGPKMVSHLLGKAIGAAVPGINLGILKELPVVLPPLPIQRRIAGILSAYDDLIENSQRRIKILEEMARRLYREWFVDGADSDSWPDARLGDLFELKRGYDLPAKDRRQGLIPIVSSSGITGFHDAPMATGPGIVTGRYGTLGEVHLVWNEFWPLNTSLYVKDFKGTPFLYVLWLLRYILPNQKGSAAAVPGLNRNDLHSLPIKSPPPSVMKNFHDFCLPLASQARCLNDSIENLRRTRDLLLPRLLSGQIDVEALDHA